MIHPISMKVDTCLTQGWYEFVACTHGGQKNCHPHFKIHAVKAVVCCSNSDITPEANLNSSETICCLLLKLTYLDIIHLKYV